MRQKNETATRFNQLKEIAHKSTLTPKARAHAKKGAFKPPKQKSQISLVFGMNALVPLGTI